MRPVCKEAIDLIKSFESCRLSAYDDGTGVPTIGYGHIRGVHYGDRISQAQADELFIQDLAPAARAVDKLVKVPLSDAERGALISFVFNCGPDRLQKSSLLRQLNQKRYGVVPAELMKYRYASGKVLKGLVRRRAAEGALWASETPSDDPDKPLDRNDDEYGGSEVDPHTPTIPTVSPEVIVATSGGAGTILTAIAGSGPLQWVMAAAVIVALIILAMFAYKRFHEV
jgi:lysozyme